jgi:hypothetical protein
MTLSSKQKSEKQANQFVIRVAEGMAGWASFAQAARMSPVYSEALIYRPIFEIAKSRGWKVRPQKKLAKRNGGPGRNKTVDFVFQTEDRDIGIFLEAKFVRYSAKHCLQVTKDVHKLISLTKADISEKSPPKHVYRYILIIGRDGNIKQRVKSRTKKTLKLKQLNTHEDKRLLDQIETVLKTEGREPNRKHGWAFPGLGGSTWRYWAVILCEHKWWSTLANLGKLADAPDENDDEIGADDLDLIDTDVENEET